MGMNLLINAALRETRGPKTESGIYHLSNRGFIDLTHTTTTHVQARCMLTVLTDVMGQDEIQGRKVQISDHQKGGRPTYRFTLQVQNEEIPSIMKSTIDQQFTATIEHEST
ncbi:hypothetical protein DPMN_113456 [Dreissena polymorpha]|uniref:Uncharacterized protein n=1 Tax=Dreissena polymorpha TaxID=45954 RepID=A0A9D4QRV8_DREPO|nr:hypothetical protein DPMN_113456 [Dreissena polymorpha]